MQKSTVWIIVILVILEVFGIILLSLQGQEWQEQSVPEDGVGKELVLPEEGLNLEGDEEPVVE